MSKEPKLKKNLTFKRCIVLLFFFYIFLLSLSATETGRLSLTFQNQSFKTLDKDSDYFSSLNSIYLNLWQGLGQGSSFNFSINYYFDRGLSGVSFYNVNLMKVPLGKFKMDADFGTIFFPTSSLPFFGSFNPTPYRGLKGGKISFTSKKNNFILFGGQLYGDFGYHNEKTRIYGVRATSRPSRRWTLGTGWMKVLDMPSCDSLGSSADYDVFSLDSSILTFKNLYLLGDFRYIFNRSQKNKDGFSVKTGTYYNAGKVSFEIYYNYLSPNYPILSNVFIQDHKGITIMGQYRPAFWLSLFGGLDTYNEELQNVLGQYPTNFMVYRFGSTINPKALPQLAINYNKSIKEIPVEGAPDSGLPASHAESSFDMLLLSLSQQYHRFFWSIYYNTGKYNKPGEITGNHSLNRIFWNLRWFYPTGHDVYITGALDQTTWQVAALDTKNFNVQLGANLRMASYLQLNIQGDYAVDKCEARAGENRRFGFSGGVIYRFKPLKINCALRYQYVKSEVPLTGIPAKYLHQAFVSITRDFRWGTESPGFGLPRTGTSGNGTGKIKGCVFVDINQNGLQEQGEDGLEDIYIFVDNIRTVKTDKKGCFSIASIPVGPHRISFDLKNIPAFYEAAKEKTEITIKKKETTLVNLTVIPVGLLTGQVILDKNENNIPDKDEPFLANIRVNLYKEDKLLRWDFTNSKGVFMFDNIRPGLYLIKVDKESVFEKYNGLDKAALHVTVNPWEEKKGLIILLNEYKKNRVKKVLDY